MTQSPNTKISEYINFEHNAQHVHLAFATPLQVVSSAVLNGGECYADHLVNMHVTEIDCEEITESPDLTISNYCSKNNWNGRAVGMMTSAPMTSYAIAEDTTQEVNTAVLVTSGLSNARRAGDKAEHRQIGLKDLSAGTINIVLITTAILSPKALIESVQIITEAKVAFLEKTKIKSPVSRLMATGTGTDSVAVVNGQGPMKIEYCGKHMLFGEIIAKLTIKAIEKSRSQCK